MGAALIPKGYRVVSVRVDSVSGGSGLILPGNRVDIMVHVVKNPGRGIPETGTKTVLQDVQVFAVNDLFTRDPRDRDETSIAAKTISLLVTPPQAQLVMLISEIGTIRLVLRNHEDEEMADVTGTEIHQLLGTLPEKGYREDQGESAPAEPDKRDLVSMLDRPDANVPKAWVMLLLKGQSAEEVEFQAADRLPEVVSGSGSIRIPRGEKPPIEVEPSEDGSLTLPAENGGASTLDELFDGPSDAPTDRDYWGEDY